jgi:hypothetical protein
MLVFRAVLVKPCRKKNRTARDSEVLVGGRRHRAERTIFSKRVGPASDSAFINAAHLA